MFDLYDYQQEAVDKLSKVPCSLIASDIGTGKTIMAMALDRSYYNFGRVIGPTLVVCPLSVTGMWATYYRNEGQAVSICNPKNRSKFLDELASVYVVHWEAMRLLAPELAKRHWGHIIADEVHRIQTRATRPRKGSTAAPKGQTAKALKSIPAAHKTGLSGTPVTNTPDKLWSILNWLYPKKYTSYWKFYYTYVDYETDYFGYKSIIGVKNEDQLHREIEPFFVRHHKSIRGRKEPYTTEIRVTNGPKQKRAYEEMKKDMVTWIGSDEDQLLATPSVIGKLMRLQQFANAYAYIDATGKVRLSDPSAKLDAMMELLRDNPETQFVIFSQFEQMINLFQERMVAAKVKHSIYTGPMSRLDRLGSVTRFINNESQVFAGTIASCGESIDGLQVASTVGFLDRSWSPSANDQAIGRVDREGQTAQVQVIDFVAHDTVTTIDLDKQARLGIKAGWLKKLLGDG